MKKLKAIASLLLSAIICLTAASCGNSGNSGKALVDAELKDRTNEIKYEFKVDKNKEYSVKRIILKPDSTQTENAEGTVTLSDKQFDEIKKLIGNINDIYDDETATEDSGTYKISLNGGKYSRHEFGSAVKSGYDLLLTELISDSSIDVIDGYGAKIAVDYEDNYFVDDIGRNSNIKVSYDNKSKTLIFSGKGKMEDYEYEPPWYDIKNPIHIVVEQGITRICTDAFTAGIDGNSGTPRYDFQYTQSVKLPDSLTEIGDYAFFYCRNLTKITLPKNLKRIGEKAFDYCRFKSVIIPKSVTTIGDEALGYNGPKIKGFTIKGYKGTAAEKYAEKNGFKFISL